jgi:hypothetical protein
VDAAGEGWSLREWNGEVEFAIAPNCLCNAEEEGFEVKGDA